MFDAVPAASAPADAPPLPEPRAERRMRRLEQVAEMGVDVARMLKEQIARTHAWAQIEPRPREAPGTDELVDLSRAFAQVGRTVGVLSTLEDRIDRGLPAIPERERE